MAIPKVVREDVEVEDVVCHQLEIAVQAMLGDFARKHPQFEGYARNAKLQLAERDLYQLDNVARGLVACLTSWVLQASHPEMGYLTFEYKVPTTWFDHLKQSIKYSVYPRWIPTRLWAWFVGKLEVKLTLKTMTKGYVKNINVCPHSNTEFPDRNHIRFLMMEDLPVKVTR
jgi:hypothetical protein